MQYALAGIQWIDCTQFELGVEHLMTLLDRKQQGELLIEFIHRHDIIKKQEHTLNKSAKETCARVYSQYTGKLWNQPSEIQFRTR